VVFRSKDVVIRLQHAVVAEALVDASRRTVDGGDASAEAGAVAGVGVASARTCL
jgi:hypothetical protein